MYYCATFRLESIDRRVVVLLLSLSSPLCLSLLLPSRRLNDDSVRTWSLGQAVAHCDCLAHFFFATLSGQSCCPKLWIYAKSTCLQASLNVTAGSNDIHTDSNVLSLLIKYYSELEKLSHMESKMDNPLLSRTVNAYIDNSDRLANGLRAVQDSISQHLLNAKNMNPL